MNNGFTSIGHVIIQILFVAVCVYAYQLYNEKDDEITNNTKMLAEYQLFADEFDSLSYSDMIGIYAKTISRVENTPVPEDGDGNCLPVAQKLRDTIKKSDRKAVIIVTLTLDGTHHAIVAFDSDKNGTYDSIIDNGYTTDWIVQNVEKREYNPFKFGFFIGECAEPTPNSTMCTVTRMGISKIFK